MKKCLALIAISAATLLLAGCNEGYAPLPNNPQTTVAYNGTVEGCRLYRVAPEHGEAFHLAICRKEVSTASTQNCGKACTRHVRVQTEGDDEQ